MKETGIKRTEDGGVFCEKCGNDLSKQGSATFSAHMDGKTCYTDVWTCNQCGAPISQTHERSKADAAWWG